VCTIRCLAILKQREQSAINCQCTDSSSSQLEIQQQKYTALVL
jgi:hypothetical protein